MSDSTSERISATRAELESTLDAIEDKLNPVKQAARLGERVKANPLPFVAGAIGAVAVIAGIVGLAANRDD